MLNSPWIKKKKSQRKLDCRGDKSLPSFRDEHATWPYTNLITQSSWPQSPIQRIHARSLPRDHPGCFAGVSSDVERCFLSFAVVKKTRPRLHVAATLMLSWEESCLEYRDPLRKWRPRNRKWVRADAVAWVAQLGRVWTQSLFWSLLLEESTKFRVV